MSDTLQEVDTSDDEITMFDPFDSEEGKDSSSDDDIMIVPRKKDDKSIEPKNLVEVTLSESDKVILMDPFEEQASPKEKEQEDTAKVSDEEREENEEEEEKEGDITLVELDESSVERKEGEMFLAPRSRDNDQGAIRRKRQRAKKVYIHLRCSGIS